jgi:tetratricopeptide (TPR) repeat protein
MPPGKSSPLQHESFATATMNFDHFRFTARAVLLDWVRQPTRPWRPMSIVFRADPRDVRAARSVAWIHAQKQRWTAAVEWFGKALELEPEHADTWFNLGYAREHAGDRPAALEAFRRAAELNPKHDRAWYGHGHDPRPYGRPRRRRRGPGPRRRTPAHERRRLVCPGHGAAPLPRARQGGSR